MTMIDVLIYVEIAPRSQFHSSDLGDQEQTGTSSRNLYLCKSTRESETRIIFFSWH